MLTRPATPTTPSTDTRAGTGVTSTSSFLTLPPAAAVLDLPVAATTASGQVVLAKPTVTLRRGIFTIRLEISLSGGTSRLLVEGYRGRRWHRITLVTVAGSKTLVLRVRNTGFLGFLLTGTIPRQSGFRVGRIVRVPAKYLRVG